MSGFPARSPALIPSRTAATSGATRTPGVFDRSPADPGGGACGPGGCLIHAVVPEPAPGDDGAVTLLIRGGGIDKRAVRGCLPGHAASDEECRITLLRQISKGFWKCRLDSCPLCLNPSERQARRIGRGGPAH